MKQSSDALKINKKELYIAFLQASNIRFSSTALSDVSPEEISHDVISKWLKKEDLRPKEVWLEAKKYINKSNAGALIIDDTVLDKRYSKKIELARAVYSGNEHDIVTGINMTNLVWHDLDNDSSLPVDFRVYDKENDGKTKNDHFREMLNLSVERGLKPEVVLGDTWYSGLENLKFIRDLGLSWVMGLRKNRSVNRKEQLENIDIPDEGCRVHLKGYGWITVFRFVAKNGRTTYVGTNIESPTRNKIINYVKMRWNIEVYHRELKQTCGIENCQARSGRTQRNHILLSVLAWLRNFKRRNLEKVSYYQLKWNAIKPAIRNNMILILQS